MVTTEVEKQDTVAVTALKDQHSGLLARKQLNASLAAVLWRRSELERLLRLRKCREQCDTTQISKKNSEFRNTYLTAGLEAEIKKEVRSLGLAYLPIKIEAKTERGTSYVGVGLDKIAPARNSNVLSEGEFRALALACFFAEIATMPNQSGVVIDDPVSSLDHRYMRRVARRVVQEAKRRPQVIVFTHDLSFYYEVWSAAAEEQVPLARNWVERLPPDRFGVVRANDGPWQVKKTKERINILNEILTKMPEDPSSLNDYARSVGEFYTRLRETWERLVEERLLNGVVGRFQPGVQTQSLRGVSVLDRDYSLVFFQMKRVSELSGHDWAVAREGALPSKADMQTDFAVLRTYEAELSKRSQQLDSDRRALEQPPIA